MPLDTQDAALDRIVERGRREVWGNTELSWRLLGSHVLAIAKPMFGSGGLSAKYRPVYRSNLRGIKERDLFRTCRVKKSTRINGAVRDQLAPQAQLSCQLLHSKHAAPLHSCHLASSLVLFPEIFCRLALIPAPRPLLAKAGAGGGQETPFSKYKERARGDQNPV